MALAYRKNAKGDYVRRCAHEMATIQCTKIRDHADECDFGYDHIVVDEASTLKARLQAVDYAAMELRLAEAMGMPKEVLFPNSKEDYVEAMTYWNVGPITAGAGWDDQSREDDEGAYYMGVKEFLRGAGPRLEEWKPPPPPTPAPSGRGYEEVPPTLPTGRRKCYYCDKIAIEIRNEVPTCGGHGRRS